MIKFLKKNIADTGTLLSLLCSEHNHPIIPATSCSLSGVPFPAGLSGAVLEA